MAKKQLYLSYALKNGVITSIEDVESGLKCACYCPACGEELVAKKGTKRMHHFAHHDGQTCEYGYESSLHLAAKDILSKAKKIYIPPVYVNFPDSPKKEELVCEAKEIPIERVELEKRFNDIIPDVVVYTGGKQFFVEIYVTHCIDDEKLKKIREADISTIEIDLSKRNNTITTEELTELLLSNSAEKKWKYNSLAETILQLFIQLADRREIIIRGLSMQVDNCPCPDRAREWRGKPYANYIDDCVDCEYCISQPYEGGMLCSGRTRIATVGDLKSHLRSQRTNEKR